MEIEYHAIMENLTTTANELKTVLSFHENCVFFKGHFENFPVLPGVVQLHYAVRLIREYFCKKNSVRCFKKVKFSKTILPRQKIFLKLTKRDEDRFFFLFETEDKDICSSGEIQLDCHSYETY